MASRPPPVSSPKRPRLSLQINGSGGGRPVARCFRGFPVDPSDPTAFNTLSNAYTTAVERSTPVQYEPLTAIKTSLQTFSIVSPIEPKDLKPRVIAPYVASLPETPVSAGPSPAKVEMSYPSTMTATPPLSGQPPSATEARGRVFSFSAADTAASPLVRNFRSPRTAPPPLPHRAATLPLPPPPPPYTHPRSLHSILRNSPLPPRTAIPTSSSLSSARKPSVRIQEGVVRRVNYCSPIEQEITTTLYTRSHIDLLVEDASPVSASPLTMEPGESLGTVADTETSAAGAVEDVRRKMVGPGRKAVPSSPSAGPVGIRKRARKEKRRNWVWTIGEDDEEENDEVEEEKRPSQPAAASVPFLKAPGSRARMAVALKSEAKAAAVEAVPESAHRYTALRPQPSIESVGSSSLSSEDVEMSDVNSFTSEESYATSSEPAQDQDFDIKTPTQQLYPSTEERLLPALRVEEAGKNTPTPV